MLGLKSRSQSSAPTAAEMAIVLVIIVLKTLMARSR